MTELDFDALITPIKREQFFSEYWETNPLRISRKQSDFYVPIVSGADIDYILSAACLLDREGVELLGSAELVAGSANKPASALYQSYRQGASIRIRGIHRYWKPIWTLCLRIQEVFGFQVSANLYCTPANSHGLDRHYDLHDTVILQIAGSKHWRVFGSPIQLPLEHAPLMKFERSGETIQYRGAPVVRDVVAKYGDRDPTEEFVIEQGDLLYLPRGFVHEAWSENEVSAHVTVGIYPVTWVDLITVALGQLGHDDVRFRTAIPAGFTNRSAAPTVKEHFDTLLQELAKRADLSKAVEEINGSLIWNQQALGEGSITHTLSQPIDMETLVERRPGLLCRFVIDGQVVRLAASHGDVSLPRPFEPAIRFVSENQSFVVREIPGRMSEHSKISLVRRLVDGGFYRVANSFGNN